MKKLGILLGLVLLAVPVIALACTRTVSVSASSASCETIQASGTMTTDQNGDKLRVELYLDGVLKDTKDITSNNGQGGHTATVSFSGATSAGSHTVVVKGYLKSGNSYGLIDTKTKTITVVACYTECALINQVPQGKVYGTTVDVPPPFGFGPWVSNGDGTFFTHIGTMNTTTPWTEVYKDGKTGKVCRTAEGADPGTRPESETMQGYSRVDAGADCDGAWATLYTYNPSDELVNTQELTYAWVLPYDLESTVLFNVLIQESEECEQPEPSDDYTSINDCTGVVVTKNFYLDGKLDGSKVVETFLWVDPYTTETFQSAFFKEPFVEPKTCEQERTHCKVTGSIWYQCNSGAWLYGTGILRDCVWCGGLNGNRVVKESYDCGQTWTYYYNGEKTDENFSWLGRYPCPSCR